MLRRFFGVMGFCIVAAWSGRGGAAVEVEVTAEGVGAGTTSPVVVVEHVELRFPNGTGRQTVAKDEPGFYAEAWFRYQGNGTLRIQWIVDGRILVETVETLTYGTDLVTRSDKTGVALPTFEPGAHTVTLTFDNGSGQPPTLRVPTITYFVAQRVPPARPPGLRLTAPADGAELDPRLLAFAWRPEAAPRGYFGRYRVEVTAESPVSPKAASGKGRTWGGAGPVLAAEATRPGYVPPVARSLELAPGRYRWRVIGFPADGSDPVESGWGAFRLAEPPPPGGVFFRSIGVAPGPAEDRTGVVEPPLERLTESLNRVEQVEVEAGRRTFLRVRVENSSFLDRQGLVLEVSAPGSGLVFMGGVPRLPACGSAVPTGTAAPWEGDSEYLTGSDLGAQIQAEVDRARALLDCRGSFAELAVAWDVPLVQERGELILAVKDGPLVLDSARLSWQAEPAQGAGGFDFSEYAPSAGPGSEGEGFPDGRPSYLDLAGFRIEVAEYDARSSGLRGLFGRGTVRWRGDANDTPIPVSFQGVHGEPGGGPATWRVTRGVAELEGDPVTLSLAGHTVRVQRLRLEPDRARADVAVVLTATTPWSPRFPVWVGARDVPVLNGGEFVAEAVVPPGTVLPGNVPPPGMVATYLPVDVFAGGSNLLMDFSPHLGYGPTADEPEWTGLAVVSALVRVPVQALDDVVFTPFDEALLGLFDTREPARLYGRAPFLRLSPSGSVSAEGVVLVPATRVPPDVLEGDPRGEMEPLFPSGLRIGFSGGTFDLVDGGVGGLDLAGWIRLPQDLGGGTLRFRHLRRGSPDGSTLRGFHTESVTGDLPAVTFDGFTYRPARARLVLPGGAATASSGGLELRTPSRFTWPADEDAFRERVEELREIYARGPGLHLEGGSLAGARAWSRKVGAFDGRVENLLLRVEEGALVENRARGVIRVPPPAGLTLAFEGSVAADGSVLVPEDGLLAPPAEGGWPLDYWHVTLYPGRHYVESAQLAGRPVRAGPEPQATAGVEPVVEGSGPGADVTAQRPEGVMAGTPAGPRVPRDPTGAPTEIAPRPGGRAGGGATTVPPPDTGGDVSPDVARRLGNVVDADQGFAEGAGAGGWGMGPAGDQPGAGRGGYRLESGPRGQNMVVAQGGSRLDVSSPGHDAEMVGAGAPAPQGPVMAAKPPMEATADIAPAGAEGDRGPLGPGSRQGPSGKDRLVAGEEEEDEGPMAAEATLSPEVARVFEGALPGVLSDGAFVIDAPLDEGGLRGFWLYMDRPDPARTADYGPARGVVFDTDRIEVQGAGITFDVPAELGGPEFGVAGVLARQLAPVAGPGGPQAQFPVPGPGGTGEFRITLDIFPDGNIGYDGDPRANPRVEPVGSVGFLGIPFTPSGEVRFARYAPRAAASGPDRSDAVAGAVPTSALGLRTDQEADAPVAAAVPLVTFEGTLHFPFFGSRRARIQHTASGARVPFLSGPEQSCADLLKENGIDQIPWGLPDWLPQEAQEWVEEGQEWVEDQVEYIGRRPEDASPNTICGDSRGYVVGRVNLRYVNTFGRDRLAEGLASAGSEVWFPDESGEPIRAEAFKGFLGQGEFSVLGVLKLVGVADVVRTDDGTLVERVSLGQGVHAFRALLAALNPARTSAKLGTSVAEVVLDMPEEAEVFGQFVGDAVAFTSTLALASLADACAAAGTGGAGATGGVTAAVAGVCAPLVEEFNRMLVTDGANLQVSAMDLVELLVAELLEQAGIEIDLPDDAEKWLEFGPDVIRDLVRDVANLVNFEKVPPEELVLGVVRTLDNVLSGMLLGIPENEPGRIVPLGIHLPVLPARKFLEQGSLREEDVWRVLRETVEFVRLLADVEEVRSQQPLLPLMARLADLIVDLAEELRNARPGSPPQVDLEKVLRVVTSVPDAACGLADQNPEAAEAIVQAVADATGVRKQDIRNALALSRRVMGWVEHPALSGGSPDAARVVRELVIPLVDDLRRANAGGTEFCTARPGYDPYDAQAIAVLNVLAQVLRLAEVEAVADPTDRARQRFFWVVGTQRAVARAVNTLAEEAGREPPIPPLAFTLFDAVERAWAIVTAEDDDPASVRALRAADSAVYVVGQDPDLSGLPYTPQTVELVRAVLAEAMLLARAAEAAEPPEPAPVVRGAARIADAVAQMPVDRDVRQGLTLLARALEIVAAMEVWQGPAPPDGRQVLRLVEDALEALRDLAQDENARRAVEVALHVAHRMGTALLRADPADPDTVVAAARGLLQDLAPLLGEAGTAAGLVEGSVVALSRIATDPRLEGFALQAAPTVDVLERALGDEGLPEGAREHLEAAVRYLERVLDDPRAPYELRDADGNLRAARRVAPDGTAYTYNARTRRYRIERPDGRVEEYEDVDPEAFERYTAPGADPDRPEPEKLFSVEIPIDLEGLTGVLSWDKLTGLVRWEYVLAPLALPGVLVWKAGEAVWDAVTGFWAYLKERLGREPEPATKPPRPDPDQEVVKAQEPAAEPQAPPGGPSPEDLEGWRVEYRQGFVWLRGPRGQWIRRLPGDPVRDPDTGAIDITGALSGAEVRAPFRGQTVWLTYEGGGYVRVRGDGWTRIYEAAGDVEVWPAGDLARVEWTPGNLVFTLETDAGGYVLAAHRGAGVSVRLYPGRFEVRPAEFLGGEIVSDPAPAVTWHPDAGRWEGPEPQVERGDRVIPAGDEQIRIRDGLARTAPAGSARVLAVGEGTPPRGRVLAVRWNGGAYRFEAWRPDTGSDQWSLHARAYGFEERAGPVVLPAGAPGPVAGPEQAGEPEPGFRSRREPDGTRVEETPTGTLTRRPSGRTQVEVENPQTGERRAYEYDEDAPVFDPPPPAPEPVAGGEPGQAAEADTIRRARDLRRKIREAPTPEDLMKVLEDELPRLGGRGLTGEDGESRTLTDREEWELDRTLQEAEAQATRRWLRTSEACLDSGTTEEQWACTESRGAGWLAPLAEAQALRQALGHEGQSAISPDTLPPNTRARVEALLHRQDLLLRHEVRRYREQKDALSEAEQKAQLRPLAGYCARMQLLGWGTWGLEATGCDEVLDEARQWGEEFVEEANAFLLAGLLPHWAALRAEPPGTGEEARRLYDALAKARDWAVANPDHVLSLRTLLGVAQKAAENSSGSVDGGPTRGEWLGLVLDAARLVTDRVLQPLEDASVDREALEAPEARRRLVGALRQAVQAKRVLDGLGVAGVSGSGIQTGLEDFGGRLDAQVGSLVEAVRRGDPVGTWFRALSDLHRELAAAGVEGRSPTQAVREAILSAAPSGGGAPGCLACHNGSGGRLTRQQARELLRLLRFAARSGEPVQDFISPDEAVALLEHLWQGLLQDLDGAPEDAEIQQLVEEFARVVALLRSAGVAVPERFGTGEVAARQEALRGVLRNRMLDLKVNTTLANLVAVLRAARTYHRATGFLAWHDPDFVEAASNFDRMAGQVARSGDPSLPGRATPRELGWALDVVAELAPADPAGRAVFAPDHTADPGSVEAFVGFALDMLSASDRMNRRGEPGPGEPGWVLVDQEALLGRIDPGVRTRFLARAAEVLAARLRDAPDYGTVREAVALAELAERLGAADLAGELRRAAASGVGALVRAPATDPAHLDRQFAMADEAGTLSESPEWQRLLAEELGDEAPHASPADLVAMALLRVRQALEVLGPSRPRGLALVGRAVLAVRPDQVVNAPRHEVGLAAAGNLAAALDEEWGQRAVQPVREAVRGALRVLADPAGAARAHLPALVAQAASSASYALTGRPLDEPERQRVRAAVRAFLRGDLRAEPMTPAEAARALAEVLEALGEPDTPAARVAQRTARAALAVAAVLHEQAARPETVAFVVEVLRLLSEMLDELRSRAGFPEDVVTALGWLARLSSGTADALERAGASEPPDAPAWAVILAGLGASVFEPGSLEGDLYQWAVAQAPAAVETASQAAQGGGPEAALPLLEQLARAGGAPALTCILNRHTGVNPEVPPGLSLLPLAAGIELAREPELLESQDTLPQAGLNVAAGLFNVVFSDALAASCPDPRGLPEQDTAVGAFVRHLGRVGEMESDLEFAGQMLIDGVRAAEEAAGQPPDLAEALQTVWDGPETVDYGNGPVQAGNTGLRHLIRGDADLLEVGLTAPRTAQAVFEAVVRKVEALNDPFLSRLLDLLTGACPPGTPAGPGGLLVLAPDRCWDGLTNVVLAVLEELRIGAVFLAEVSKGERPFTAFEPSREHHMANAANPDWDWGWLRTAPFREDENGWLVFDRDKMEQADWLAVPDGLLRQMVAGIDVARWAAAHLAALAESLPEYENPGEEVLAQSPLGDRALGGQGFSGVSGGWVGAVRPDGTLDNYLSLVGNLEFPVLGAAAAQVLYKPPTRWPDTPFEPSDMYLLIRMGSGVPETETLSRYFGGAGEWFTNLGAQVLQHASRLDARLGPQHNEFLLTSLTKYFGFELGRFVLRGRVNLDEDSPGYLNGELCSALTVGFPALVPGTGLPFPGGTQIGGEGRLWRWGDNAGFGLAVNVERVAVDVDWPAEISLRLGATLGAALSSRSGRMCARPYVEGRFKVLPAGPELRIRNDMLAGVQVYNGPGGPGIKARYLVNVEVPTPGGPRVVRNTFWVYFAPREVYLGVLTPPPGGDEPPPYPNPGQEGVVKVWFHEDGSFGGVEAATVGAWGGWAAEDPFGELCTQDLTCGIQME